MSVSGVGGTNPWLQDWTAPGKARNSNSAQKAESGAGMLGQQLSVNGLGQSAVQSVTSASGGQMNPQDSNSFGQSMATLSQAIQGGDVGTAQDAFARAKELLQSAGVHGHHHHHHGGAKPAAATGAGASTDPADPFAAAFGAIGQALKAGDLAGAQSALTRLDGLLQDSPRKLTSPPVGADSPAVPTGGAIDLTA